MNAMKRKLSSVFILGTCVAACTRVQPGHVGVAVDQYGSGAGVQSQALGVGTYWYQPGRTIYEYPIYTSTYTWTKSKDEGSNANEEFSFQDRSGLVVTADVAVAYRVDPVKAPILFQKYRTDMEGIVAGPLRNAIRSALVEAASNITVEDIYGPKKTQLINAALTNVQHYFEPFGLHVEQLYWASSVRIPESILEQINAKIRNEQQALAAQANVATVKANAEAAVAEATGKAEATKIEAGALRASPEILRQRAIEKWDGKLPTYVGASAPIPFISER
jgi:regulator of protease activity HflC (stomatin/prohibitin superfamily)